MSLAPHAIVRWSSGDHWGGLRVEHHGFGACDPPAFAIPDPRVVLHLTPATKVESERIPEQPSRRVVQEREEVLVMTLSPQLVRQAARQTQIASLPERIGSHPLRDAQIDHIGRALEAEATAGFPSGRLYGETLGMALAVHVLTLHAAPGFVPRTHRGGMAPHSVRRVTAYIQENLAQDVSLATLAQEAGLSPHRFAHNFKHATGLAPHQYVIRERMERAKRLLRDTDMTITAIALDLGCRSPSRFALLFRRATGATPSAYRSSRVR